MALTPGAIVVEWFMFRTASLILQVEFRPSLIYVLPGFSLYIVHWFSRISGLWAQNRNVFVVSTDVSNTRIQLFKGLLTNRRNPRLVKYIPSSRKAMILLEFRSPPYTFFISSIRDVDFDIQAGANWTVAVAGVHKQLSHPNSFFFSTSPQLHLLYLHTSLDTIDRLLTMQDPRIALPPQRVMGFLNVADVVAMP